MRDRIKVTVRGHGYGGVGPLSVALYQRRYEECMIIFTKITDLSEVGMATLNAGIGDGTNALPRYRPFVPRVRIVVMMSLKI